MNQLRKTVLYDRHVALGANMVEFGEWNMPLHYRSGIVEEHLLTRKRAGLFDVSHMGRFAFRGKGMLPFLQHVLSNNAEALEVGQCHYTIIPNDNGGAIDDAYLYRFVEDEYLLVVNAENREKDWDHFQRILKGFEEVEMVNQSEDTVMFSLQGPSSKLILTGVIDSGSLPEPIRNTLSIATINAAKVLISTTGYTGEPICFELFTTSKDALTIWDLLIERGAAPVGLGARDTLRLEASLPLYGHELGLDPEGREIPILSCPLSKLGVSFSSLKGDFIGKNALMKQFEALKKTIKRDYSLRVDLPRLIRPVALAGRGVARAGAEVFVEKKQVGFVTSGTMVPYWKTEGRGLSSRVTEEKGMRAICCALLDSNLHEDDRVEVEIRGKRVEAVIVPFHLRSEAPPHARPILWDHVFKEEEVFSGATVSEKVHYLLKKTMENTIWRQTECINLIPSEQTQSPMTRLLSIMDPAFRYAEHKRIKAFYDADIFYYQGTDFIEEAERLLENELRLFLSCTEVETRLISGQMANTAVFSAMVDYLNRADRKSEPRRIRYVLNNHIMTGGHLSAQPMGALRDFVAHNPKTEKPAVVNFPILPENPYKIDVSACREIIAEYKPELIIFGKSMVLHPEPVAQIKSFVDDLSVRSIIMYDMAHVLGIVGPYFQEPFKEGVDIVTASTHKTFFGTQRGIAASNYKEQDEHYEFWEAITRRTFPGSVSNHHLGTMVGLLMAAYEMNYFKDEYQKKVLANAKAFARALKDSGMDVGGDPDVSYTETHQVIINIGYGKGPEVARKLEENNIIVNYQATAEAEGFTVAGSLRLGVTEMTRFGMEEENFRTLAQFIHDVVIKEKSVKEEVKSFRKRFSDLKFRFSGKEFDAVMERLHRLI